MQRFIFLAYFFICVNCFSQQYPFVHYTPKDGLVNSRVKKAYQDSEGRMYFLTFGGLSVFDGARFRNYTIHNGLPTNIINDILEVGPDSLLVASNGPALNALVKGKMTLVKTTGDSCPLINRFYRHDQNKIYLSCDYGLFVLENHRIRHLDVSFLSKHTPLLPYLGNITGVGNYLVLTTNELRDSKGLYIYDIKNNRVCDALPEPTINILGKDYRNNVWLSTSNKLFILDTIALSKGKLKLISPLNGYQQFKNYSTANVAFDKNCIWLVYKRDFRNTEIRWIDENGFLVRMPLPLQTTTTDIKNIFIDRENTVWLCSDGEGVFKIGNSPLQIFQNPLGESIQSQITGAYYANDVTWYRTSNNHLFRKSGKGLQEFNSNLKESPVVFYEKGSKLLAHDIRNIYEANLPAEHLIRFRKIISLPGNDFFPKWLKVDNNGAILAAQNSGLTVWKNNKPIVQLPITKYDVIEEFAFDKNNLLWVAKRYNGIEVFRLHPENLSNYLQPVYHFTTDQVIGSPRCLVIDRNGLIWVGTRDHGVICYQQEGNRLNKLYQFDVGNGLTDNFVTTLACDSFNNIIVGTQTGLDRIVFNSNAYRLENFSRGSNFFALIFQAWADSRQAYALTYSGVVLQLSHAVEQKISNNPRLLLEEMRVNAANVSTERNNFHYKENNLSFLVAAPTFIDEKQVTYSYLLRGSGNQKWSDTASANAVINLTNLSPGKYLLRVKAFFPSTSYAPAELSYPFLISPPWWQTWWFRAMVGIMVIGLLIIGFRNYYKRKLEKQKTFLDKQKAIEKERTRIATDMHDDLGAGLSRIKFLSETIGIKKQQQQPIEEDINKIREYSHEMIDKMGEIVWALNERNDSLSDLLSYSRSYATEYLSQNGITSTVKAPDNFPAVFVSGEFRRNIYLAFKEALHNVVKHAYASHVNIFIDITDYLSISVQDDGIGFYQGDIKPFSNGLTNMEKRMKDIGGVFEVKPGNGTFIKLTVPLPS